MTVIAIGARTSAPSPTPIASGEKPISVHSVVIDDRTQARFGALRDRVALRDALPRATG